MDISGDTPAESADQRAAAATERVIELFGGIRPMAAKLEIPVTTVQYWKKRGHIPLARHDEIRAAAERHGLALAAADLAATDPQPGGSAEAAPAEAAPAVQVYPAPEAPRTEDVAVTPPPALEPAAEPPLASTAAADARDPIPGDGAPAAAPAARRPVGSAVAVGAALIALLGAGAAWLPTLQQRGLLPAGLAGDPAPAPSAADPQLAARVTALQTAFADLEQRLAAAEAGRGQGQGQGQGQAPAAAVDLAPLTERLDRLEQAAGQAAGSAAAPAAPAAPPVDVAALESRLGDLQNRLQALTPVVERVEALSGRIDTVERGAQGAVQPLQSEVQRLAGVVQEQGGRLAATERQLTSANMADDAGFALAVAQLRAALAASAPFAVQLAAVEKAADGDAGFAQRVEPLRARAESGIPTVVALRQRFAEAADAARRAQAASGVADWGDRALAQLGSLVTIRRSGDDGAVGGSLESVLARAEARLDADDLAGAAEALDALPAEAAAPEMTQWLEAARARVAAERLAADLTSAAAARLGGQP
ncbi:MAG TPA: mitofilin family membrane protein [Alphaproteobacteria bacterium]|nr:mitofilin family membrane protein [Alphaproteobacteria bacterium]